MTVWKFSVSHCQIMTFFIIFLLGKLGQEEDGNMRVHIGKIGGAEQREIVMKALS